MPSLKTRSPAIAKAKQLLPVEDLTGGVDLRRSQTLLPPNRARTLKNFSLEEPGALKTRKGYLAASAASFGSNPQGGQRVYLANSVFTLMALDGAVYKPSDAWVKGASVYSTISSAAQVFFPYDRDLVAVMDGANRPRFSTSGTAFSLMGTDAPVTSPTLSTASTGGLSSGKYAVAYTYKHRGTAHESNGSSASTITITGTSGCLNVQATASTDPKVDAYVFYARHILPDGESVLRKVSSGAASTLTITSSAWTSADEIPTNHNVPPTVVFAAIWKSRWWAKDAAVGNRLRFTELFQPQSWPTLYYIDIPFEKGDSITAIQSLGDTLIIYGQSGGFLVIGQTALDFEVRPSQGLDTGAFGPRAAAKVEQASLHMSGDGVGTYDGASDRDLVRDIIDGWRDLVTNTPSSGLSNVAAVHDALQHEVRISVPRVYPTAARGEWVLNLERTRDNQGAPAWTTTDRDIAFYMHWNGNEPTAGNRGRLFSIGSTGGVVMEENVGGSANSSNMTAEYEGAGLSLGVHRGRYVDAHVEYEPHSGALSIEPVVDGVSQGAIALSIGTGLYTYGSTSATYGTAIYSGAGRKKAYTPLPMGANGRSIVTKLVYTGTERMKIYTYAYGLVPEPTPLQMGE
jgi:hypothetical protein